MKLNSWYKCVTILFIAITLTGASCNSANITSGLGNSTPESRKFEREHADLSSRDSEKVQLQVSFKKYASPVEVDATLPGVTSSLALRQIYLYEPVTDTQFWHQLKIPTAKITGVDEAIRRNAEYFEDDGTNFSAEFTAAANNDVRIWAFIIEGPANELLNWWNSNPELVRTARIVDESSVVDPIRPDAPYPAFDNKK